MAAMKANSEYDFLIWFYGMMMKQFWCDRNVYIGGYSFWFEKRSIEQGAILPWGVVMSSWFWFLRF